MTTRTIPLVLAEIESARAKHGDEFERGDNAFKHLVLSEECGEVASAAQDVRKARRMAAVLNEREYPGHVQAVLLGDITTTTAHLKAELVQVAATAMRWIAVLDAEEGGMSEVLDQLHNVLSGDLDRISARFKQGVKLTLIVRQPHLPGDTSILIGNDDSEEVIREIRRREEIARKDQP